MHTNTSRFTAIFLIESLVFLSGVSRDAREPVRARNAMVVASQPAEQVGVEILRKGGNAIAVADL